MINVMLVAEDTGEETVYGEVGPADAWWSVPLPPCPSCNGLVEWAEAGQVPGTRRCAECRRFYQINTTREPQCEYMEADQVWDCLLYTSPSPRDRQKSRMPSSA